MGASARTIARVGPITAAALLLTACPAPIARTEMVSAPLVANIVATDGTPASGVEVAISTDWRDSDCRTATIRARADSLGRVHFDATSKHYSVTWIVPNLDRVPPRYGVCVAAGDTLRHAYDGVGSLVGSVDGDSVACVIWEWKGNSRVSCAGGAQRTLETGGRWTDTAVPGGSGVGFYRVYLTAEFAMVKGRRRPTPAPHVYVQWVEAATADGKPPHRVRETVLVPIDRARIRAVSEIRLWRRDTSWMMSLIGYRNGFMNDFTQAEVVYALGAPGQVALVTGP